ncbi:tandem-95 repeat protein [Heliobacterium chlorum]|uniref:Tandem-95 repeat protein n=1 Tax=Heliobacterium chlorum TaxID=2698 RepID=A0ABR7T1U2_HELCL|nr:tandem-95 repeat protein [Heliobacterium chlorum]MBC9784636.1 tandem-95 repeat protein [Heliobacterium chlorum]
MVVNVGRRGKGSKKYFSFLLVIFLIVQITLGPCKTITGANASEPVSVDEVVQTNPVVSPTTSESGQTSSGTPEESPPKETVTEAVYQSEGSGTVQASPSVQPTQPATSGTGNSVPEINDGDQKNITIDEDHSINFTVTANYTGTDDLTWTTTKASHGNAAITGSGNSATVTYSPNGNYNGTDSFTVQVSNTSGETDTLSVNLTINPINDPPVNTAEPTISGEPKVGQTLSVNNGTWNDDLDINPGQISYTYQWQRAANADGSDAIDIAGATGASYSPDTADSNRYIRVKVTAEDNGEGTPATEKTTVCSEWLGIKGNHPPVIQEKSASMNLVEDGNAAELVIHAADADEDTLLWSISKQAKLGTAAVTNGAVSFSPKKDENGADSFDVQVSDGNGGLDTITVNVTIQSVNDPPSFLKGSDQSILEDDGPQTIAGWATAISSGPANESDQTLSFTVTNNNNALFSAPPAISPNGTLSYTPAPNANGTATVTVILNDNGGAGNGGVDTSASQSFTITVNAVNDGPSFIKGSDENVLEDSGAHTVNNWATGISKGPADENGQTLSFDVTNDNKALFTVQPAIALNGILTYTLAPDQNGLAHVTVKLTDNGGTANGGVDSTEQTFMITVNAVNDAPSFIKGTNQEVVEDAGAQTIPGWATGISAGPADEAAQKMSFLVTNDSNDLFSVQPQISPEGTLTYTPKADANGIALVKVQITDDGGLDNGGVNSSEEQSFLISITPVNDPPTLSEIGDQRVNEDTEEIQVTFTVDDVDNNTSLLSITAQSTNQDLLPNTGLVIGGAGKTRTLLMHPVADKYGTAQITVTVSDEQKTVSKTFTVTVDSVNDEPTITSILNQTVDEDGATGTIPFAVYDKETALDKLKVTAVVDNATLFPESNISLGGSEGNRTISLRPAADQSGSANVTVTVEDEDGGKKTTAFTVTVRAVNDPPVLIIPGSLSIAEDTIIGPLPISIDDTETSPSELVVTAESSNPYLVPKENIELGGSEKARTIKITPLADQNGSTQITVAVDDGTTKTVKAFTVTVNPVNDAPQIGSLETKHVAEDSTSDLFTFTIGDIDNNPAELQVTALSDNPGLIPNENIILGGSGGNRTIQVTPLPNQNGMAHITLTVSDRALTNQTVFDVVVDNVNDAPEIGVIGNQEIGQGTSTAEIPFNVWDIDNDANSLELSSTISGVDGVTVVFGGAGKDRTVKVTAPADQMGIAVITVKVSDGSLSDEETFTVTVDPNGVGTSPISHIMDQEIFEDTDTGLIYFTVNSAYADNVSVTSDNQDIVPDRMIQQDVVGGDKTKRAVKVVPAPDKNGPVNITVTATTEPNGTETASRSFRVTVLPVNDEPVINGPKAIHIAEDPDKASDETITVTDADTKDTTNPDRLTVSAYSSNQVLIPDENITVNKDENDPTIIALALTPVPDRNGVAVITVSANDGHVTVTKNFTITVDPVNDPPTIGPIEDQVIDEDHSTGPIAVNVDDVELDAGSLTVMATSSNQAIVPDANLLVSGKGKARTLTITPAANQSGTVTITVGVNDGVETTEKSFTLTINPVNDAPYISYIPNQSTEEDKPTSAIPFTIGDIDSSVDSLVVNATSDNPDLIPNSAAGIQVNTNGTNGKITLTPATNQSGTAKITVTVSDGFLTATRSFTVVVTPVNDPPTITDIPVTTIDEDSATGPILFMIGDEETPVENLTLSITSGNQMLLPNSNIVRTDNGAEKSITLTPAANQNGSTLVTIKVSDGEKTTVKTFSFIVRPVNDPPTISPVDDQTILEDKATPTIVGFTVGDLEKDAGSLVITATSSNPAVIPASRLLFGGTGAFRTVRFTPLPDQNGETLITLSVNDGIDTTTETFKVYVTPVNDKPSFVKGPNQTVNEDAGTQEIQNWATAISQGPANESDQTVEFTLTNNNNSLFSEQPAVTAIGTLTYRPADNANGTATVTVTMKDSGGTANGGIDTAAVQTFTITVNSVNDAPSFTKGPDPTVNEDCGPQSIANWAGNLSKGPVDEVNQTLTFAVVSNTNPSLFSTAPSISSNGTLSFTPAANASGTATIEIKLTDNGGTANGGINQSPIQTFTITVIGVNDRPSFTKGGNQSVKEDAGLQTLLGWATAISPGPSNESAQSVTFSVTNDNHSLFSLQPAITPTGTLTYTPAENKSGTATVTVKLVDDGGTANGGTDTSVGQTFTITITPINDPPSFTLGVSPSVNEDGGMQTITGWVTGITKGPADEDSQSLTFKVDNDSTLLFTSQPAIAPDGTLSFTTAPDAFGYATVSVRAKDDGGTSNGGIDTSATRTFTITVNAVNDAPSFTKGADQVVQEDAAPQTIPNWATAISTGPSNEATQKASFVISSNSNSALFREPPAISDQGTLTYTPADNAAGTATINVKLIDDGGTDYGGINETTEQSFTITVNPVNDGPTISPIADQTIDEDTSTGQLPFIIGDVDNDINTLTLSVVSSNQDLIPDGNIQLSGSGANRTFYAAPAANQYGNSNITITVSDGSLKASKSFTVTVVSKNDNPTVENQSFLTYSGLTVEGSLSATDVDGDRLTYELSSPEPIKGSFTIDKDSGAWTFTSEKGYTVTQEVIVKVLVSDGNGGQGEGTINFTILPLPAGKDYQLLTRKNTSVSGKVATGNEDNSTVTCSLFTEPAHGTVTVNKDGSWSYTPADDFIGNDRFTVLISNDKHQYAQSNVTIIVHDGTLTLTGQVNDRDTQKAISNAEVRLLDVAGKVIAQTTSDGEGRYRIDKLVEHDYLIEVVHPDYSENRRASTITFANSTGGTVTEDFELVQFTLQLSANPTSIKADGVDETQLTATLKDKFGKPIPGIEVTFSAEAGFFDHGRTAVTNEAGIAQQTYRSEKLEGVNRKVIPVIVTVDNTEKGLYGTERIFVTFEPGFITGIVLDNNSGEPVKGAVVKVSKDFEGDGINDFSFTQVTEADGKYRIAIPRGGVDYDISITKPVLIGDTTQNVTFTQKAQVNGEVGESEVYTSNKTATGLLITKEPDGTATTQMSAELRQKMKVYLRDSNGNYLLNGKGEKRNLLAAKGDGNNVDIFYADALAEGTYQLEVVMEIADEKGQTQELILNQKADAPAGEELTKVVVDKAGQISIIEELIDPYGTITDAKTGAKIAGAHVVLYYADTPRNRANSRTPGTTVPLPEITGFAPSDNANPQNSDANGAYAFMVFPRTDYYLVATKNGYQTFTSPTISVETALVKYDFAMEPASSSHGGATEPAEVLPPKPPVHQGLVIWYSSDRPSYGEGDTITYTISYKNGSTESIHKAAITASVSGYTSVDNPAGGTTKDGKITWQVGDIQPGQVGIIIYRVKVKEGALTAPETFITEEAAISVDGQKLDSADSRASLRILLFTNRFGEGHHEPYVIGYPDKSFGPYRNITRAEVATMLIRISGTGDQPWKSDYLDVDHSHWAYKYIMAATAKNLFQGYENGTFHPDEAITRAELSAAIANFMKLEKRNPLELHFKDIEGHWAAKDIEEIYRNHIINGYPGNLFKPNDKISREETVTMVNHLLGRGPLKGVEALFPDVSPDHWSFGQVEEAAHTHHFARNNDGSETMSSKGTETR